MRSNHVVSAIRALLKTSWRWPVMATVTLCLLNGILFLLLPAWVLTSRAIATEVASLMPPVGSYSPTVEHQRLTVKRVSFEQTLSGERIVFEFANRIPEGESWGSNPHLPNDFQFSDQQAGHATLSFSGHVLGLTKPMLKPFETPNLKQVYLESHLGKVQVFLKRMKPGSANVVWDGSKNRLVVHIQNYEGKLLGFQEPRPGLTHREVVQNTAHGPLRLHILEVDPKRLEVVPVLSNGKMGSKSSVMEMVHDSGGIAGINASFFKQDSGIPIGTLILNDELVSGPLFQRVCFGIDQSNKVHMARITLKGQILIPNGDNPPVGLLIDNVNQPRIQKDQTVAYTDRWGPRAPGVPTGGVQVLLVDGRVKAVSSDVALAIPKGGVVISGAMSKPLAHLATQTNDIQVKTSFYTKPDWSNMKHAISGGPYLVHNGDRYIDLQAQQFRRGLGRYEPRSAIGVKADGTILLLAVDGRVQQSVGASLSEVSQLMQELGAVEAMNLDGGSSTQMVLAGRSLHAASAAKVSTALVVRPIQNTLALQNESKNILNAPDARN